MMRIVNLTPHEIVLQVSNKRITIPPSGRIARVATKQVYEDSVTVNGVEVPIYRTEFGKVEGLPPYSCLNCVHFKNNGGECDPEGQPDVPEQCDRFEPLEVYVVSSLVAQAVKGRKDVVAPDTGPTAIRNEQGQIVAVTRFQRW
ncbi:hypothetical protein DRO33_03915 [Candidatus Bathyarchaeota archaeon]|nr:MAG: hypothetical protein DRO33_03915 [Candidatus Bathyarchaeota archaeon]